MNWQVRRLGPEDLLRAEEAVRAFKGSCRALDSLETFLRNPSNFLLVADAQGAVAGFLLAYRLERADRAADQMFVYEVSVAEGTRRLGLASALLRRITELAREEGMFEAFVVTSRTNHAARALYARSGGVVEDEAAMLFVYPLGEKGVA